MCFEHTFELVNKIDLPDQFAAPRDNDVVLSIGKNGAVDRLQQANTIGILGKGKNLASGTDESKPFLLRHVTGSDESVDGEILAHQIRWITLLGMRVSRALRVALVDVTLATASAASASFT